MSLFFSLVPPLFENSERGRRHGTAHYPAGQSREFAASRTLPDAAAPLEHKRGKRARASLTFVSFYPGARNAIGPSREPIPPTKLRSALSAFRYSVCRPD